MKKSTLIFAALVSLAACGGESNPADEPNEESVASPDNNAEQSPSEVPSESFGSCLYTNPFSGGAECRAYEGVWSTEQVAEDCANQQGQLVDDPCATPGAIGTCTTEGDGQRATVFAYGDAGACQATGFGCTAFAKGTWEPTSLCDGDAPPTESSIFQPPELVCIDPLPGSAEGAGPQGQVCTWQLISGATEQGRRFEDYASCDAVRTQRPYYPFPKPADAERPDARLDDPAYARELDWVKSEIEATACVCCHKSSLTPEGVSNWDLEQPGNFMNGFYDSGLALGANWINSVALGTFDAEDNNGFARDRSGFPSTDPERMRAFFVSELEQRGRVENDFDSSPPFGGPLYDQIYFEPSSCEDGIGIAADGTVTWEGGGARYVSVLEAGSLSPTVPPNLDKPEGTIWKLDVAPQSAPLQSGEIAVGDSPAGTTQVLPASGRPVLQRGVSYYLYVAADVGIPITRCLTIP